MIHYVLPKSVYIAARPYLRTTLTENKRKIKTGIRQEEGDFPVKTACVIAVLFLCSLSVAQTENEHSQRLAPKYNAQFDVRMPDGTRCDLLSDKYAIETDRASKWAESVGQATLYSIWSNRKAAVLILSRGTEDKTAHTSMSVGLRATWHSHVR